MSHPPLVLTRTAALAVRRGHPWVYREGLARPPRALTEGSAVELADDEGAILARGLWDPGSPIAVRVFDLSPKKGDRLDARALARRLARAIARRDGWFGDDTTAYRLCNGEGDRLPGLVVDRYGDLAVLRLDTPALRPYLDSMLAEIKQALRDRGVTKIALRLEAPGPDGKKIRMLSGDPPPDRVIVREHGVAMEVDLAQGQKTGAFLDQRENRARLRALARGRERALNLFSYAGGFSVAMALGGASHVTSVDVASAAHATAQRTFRENGVDPSAHAFVSADAFVFLEQAKKRGQRFDLVVSDPPSFAPSERAKGRAETAYRKLHAAIAEVLDDGALFCAASCSSHITLDDFLGTLDDRSLGRSDLVVREIFGQPADHPTLPAWPEGRYLKMVVLG
ncbi:MAG: class I SAM-dependent rRNA methyltransferase [Byssovorax sp.]